MADNVQPTQDQLKYGAQHTQCRHRRGCGVLDIFVRQRFRPLEGTPFGPRLRKYLIMEGVIKYF